MSNIRKNIKNVTGRELYTERVGMVANNFKVDKYNNVETDSKK